MTKPIKLYGHLLVWTIFYLVMLAVLDSFLETSGAGDFLNMRLIAEIAFTLLVLLIVPFYIFYYLSRGGSKNRTAVFLRVLGGLSIFVLPLLYFLLDEQPVTWKGYFKVLILVVFFSLLGYLFRGFLHGYKLKQEKEALTQQLLKTELAFLKGQISPHFLFNTLNNIDALIKADPDEASRSLISMSEIMRYMIYDSRENTVPLKHELHYLENLIALYNLRLSKNSLIRFHLEGDPSNYQLPPMLLIPVAENTFKHFSNRYSQDGIDISVAVLGSKLRLVATNSYDPGLKKDNSSGLGLQTLKRPLELLFPGNYTMDISQASNIFTISLQIPLEKNLAV